jgi:hypothetical protein
MTPLEKQQIKRIVKEKMWFSNSKGIIFIEDMDDTHLENTFNFLKGKGKPHNGITKEYHKRFIQPDLEAEILYNFHGY